MAAQGAFQRLHCPCEWGERLGPMEAERRVAKRRLEEDQRQVERRRQTAAVVGMACAQRYRSPLVSSLVASAVASDAKAVAERAFGAVQHAAVHVGKVH